MDLVILKGLSGTGKGTRLFQVVQFLIDQGEELIHLQYEFRGNYYPLGILFPKYKTLFLGKVVKGKMYNWNSGDGLLTKLKPVLFLKLLNEILLTHHLVFEGLLIQGYKYSAGLFETLPNLTNLYSYYLIYDNEQQYKERCAGRGGQAKSTSVFRANERLAYEVVRPDFKHPLNTAISARFDEPVWGFGKWLINTLFQQDAGRFIRYSEEFNVLRENHCADSHELNNEIFKPLYDKQNNGTLFQTNLNRPASPIIKW